MPSKRRLSLRTLWFNIHLWIGVGLGLIMIVLGLSGATLVWSDPIVDWLNASRFTVSDAPASLPPSAYVQSAAAAFGPGLTVMSVRLPEESGKPVVVMARGAVPKNGGRPPLLSAWLDPATAEVKYTGSPLPAFFTLMHNLHGSLMIPGIGRQVVGWMGVALSISALSGIYLWWPRNNRFLRALKWRRAPMLSSNLHHSVGFWLSLPLAIIAITGIYLGFPQTGRAALSSVAPMSPQVSRFGGPGPAATLHLSVDEAVDAALAAVPGAAASAINFPSGKPAVWRLTLDRNGKPMTVSVDDATGAARLLGGGGVKNDGGQGRNQTTPGDDIAKLIRGIHDGTDMGPIWQAIVFLTGLLPALLTITGVIMWLSRRKRLKQLAVRVAAVSQSG